MFPTVDGAVCVVGAFKANPLRDICEALGLPDLSLDGRFATTEAQMAHRDELHRHFRERIATESTDHWVGKLEAVDILCAPVLSLEAALAHEQTEANGMVVETDHARVGAYRSLAAPIHMGRTPARVYAPPPMLGEHTEEVLGSAGYSEEEIGRLRDAGALG